MIARGGYLAITMGSVVLLFAIVAIAVLFAILIPASNSAADIVIRALLYNYATGGTIPEEVDESMFSTAFAAKG